MFKGNTANTNAHVFGCYEERSDRTQFPKTLEALGEYAAKNLKYPEDLQSPFREEMTKPSLVELSDLSASKKEEIIWVSNMKSFVRRSEELQSNLTTLYAIIWGQCSEAMSNKLYALDEYESKCSANDCVWILKEIKGVTHQFDNKRNMFLSLLDAHTAYYNCRQTQHQSNAEYLAIFTGNVQVLEYYKANVSESYLLVQDPTGTLKIDGWKKIARDCTIAMAFLKGADLKWYNSLWIDLANQQNRGNYQYPKSLIAAYSMIVNYLGLTQVKMAVPSWQISTKFPM
jgi:hypothetical protein